MNSEFSFEFASDAIITTKNGESSKRDAVCYAAVIDADICSMNLAHSLRYAN